MKNLIILGIGLLISYCVESQTLYFTGAVNSTWSTTGNWSTSSGGTSSGTVPGSTTPVIFDNNSPKCHITGAISIKNITMSSNFADTLFVDDSLVVTLSDTFKQLGGTFNSKNAKMTLTKGFYNTGGIFNASSKTLTIGGCIYNSGGTFNHNSGLITLNSTTNVNSDLTCYNVTFSIIASGTTTTTISSGKKLIIEGNMREELNSTSGTLTVNGPGSIEVRKNLYQAALNSNATTAGDIVIKMNGTTNQNIYGNNNNVSGKAYLPAIIVDKSSDTLFLNDSIGLMYGMNVTTGIVNPLKYNSCVWLGSTQTYSSNVTYNNVIFYLIYAASHTVTVNSGKIVTIKGSMRELFNASGTVAMTINGPGKIQLEGDLYQSPANGTNTSAGNIVIEMKGSNKQHIYGNNSYSNGRTYLPAIEVNKTGDTLLLNDTIGLMYGMNVTAGTVNTTKYNSCVFLSGSHIYSTDVTYNNVVFFIPSLVGSSFSTSINSGKTLTVLGSMREIMANTSTVIITINGPGTLALKGDLYQAVPNATTTTAGNVVYTFNGTGNQNLFGNNNLSATTCYLKKVEINKSSGTLFLRDGITSSGGMDLISGTVDATTYNSTFQLTSSYVFTNSITLNHFIINSKTTSSISVSINSGKVITVLGNMSFILNVVNASCNYTLNGPGRVDLYGNLTAPPTGHASSNGGGNALIKLIGTINQYITGNTTEGMGRFPSILVDKPSGKIYLDNRISMAGSFEVYDDTGSTTDTTFVLMYGTGNLSSGINLDIYGVKIKQTGVLLTGDLQLRGGINLSTFSLNLNSNTLYLKSNSTSAINYSTGGGIISETSNFTSNLKWQISNVSTTNYIIPFRTSGGSAALTIELRVDTTGVIDTNATEQYFRLSTYPTASNNTPNLPTIDSLTDSNGINNYKYVIDRYWAAEIYGFTTPPACNNKILYRTAEMATPNTITESNLRAQLLDGFQFSSPEGTLNTSAKTIDFSNHRKGGIFVILVDKSKPVQLYIKPTQVYAVLYKNYNSTYYEMSNTIMFKYDEKYNDNILNYKIYNWKREVVIGSESPAPIIITPVTSHSEGDNYHILNIGNNLTNNQIYFLEITNEKGEVYKMKFRYKI